MRLPRLTPARQIGGCAVAMLAAGALISGLAFALTLMALSVALLVAGLLRPVEEPPRRVLSAAPSLEDVIRRRDAG